MRRLCLLAATMLAALPAAADQRFDATLAGHAQLPAFTMALPPADAPRDALLSGKFAGPGNLDSLRILLNNVHKVVDKNIGVISGRPVSIDVGGTVAPAYELEIRIKVASA